MTLSAGRLSVFMNAQVFAGDKSELLPRSFEKSQSGDTPQTHCMIGLGLLSLGGVFYRKFIYGDFIADIRKFYRDPGGGVR